MTVIRLCPWQIVGCLLTLSLVVEVSSGQQLESKSPAQTFVERTRGAPPRDNLMRALELFSEEFEAIAKQRRLVAADLGAGAGNETMYLIKHGWDVVAIDNAPYAIATIRERQSLLQDSSEPSAYGTLRAHITPMQKMSLESESFDLINASLSLPFVSQDEIKDAWHDIETALRPGGVFTGHFFGPEHEWKGRPGMSFFSIRQLFQELFSPQLEIRYLLNEKQTVTLGVGGTAFFHTITVIAQKRPKRETLIGI